MSHDPPPARISRLALGREIHLTLNLPDSWALSAAGQVELLAVLKGGAMPWLEVRCAGVHERGGWVFCSPEDAELLSRVLHDVAEEHRERVRP